MAIRTSGVLTIEPTGVSLKITLQLQVPAHFGSVGGSQLTSRPQAYRVRYIFAGEKNALAAEARY